MTRAKVYFGSAVVLLFTCFGIPLCAAEPDVLHGAAHAHAGAHCGPCGCLRVSYVRHRAIETTNGTGFDPRNYDQTEPHFYLGRTHRYPRYFVDGVPSSRPGAC